MGDLEGGPQPSGLVPEQAALYAESFIKSRSVDNARWEKAEKRTAELIKRIRGTQSSEERRKDVADYVGDLIRKCFDCQVYTFGSVPLKTYLPDGDIDLTIVSRDPRLKDTWANSVRSVLEKAERNHDGKGFRVKEVQYINAEVKLIKCHVENIVVDISFNQFGGLCTLCFLEEVDQVIGNDHFFKRSIILVKAWCYYESTILGAHHGLISTYALETLVLYVFHVFHISLRGPLEVLLRFLEFFSKFDWHRYAVSVWGPVPLSALPEMIAESPRKDGGQLLLSKDFLDACLEDYAVYPLGPDGNQGRAFTAKHLNIVDPLIASNNLGRSVNQTNFNRIAKVWGHSAGKLLTILLDPSKDIDEYFEDKKAGFFKRTKDRLDQFEQKRPDAAYGLVQAATTRYPVLNHQSYHTGFVVGQDGENGDVGQSFVAETYYVDSNDKKKPQGRTLDLDARKQSNNQSQMRGSLGNTSHLSVTSHTAGDARMLGRASHESRFDNGVLEPSARNSSVPESSYVPVYTGVKGNLSNNEVIEKPIGLCSKSNIDSVGGISERIGKGSRHLGIGRDSVGSSTQSKERKDLVSPVEDYTLRASVASRSSYAHTNFENCGALLGISESPSSESSRGSAPEVSSEGPGAARSSPIHNFETEGSRQSGWVGEQLSYVATNGVLDGQGYIQHRGQESRGPIPLPVAVVPHGQIPVVLSHPGQLPVHLATSMAVPQTKGHLTVTLTGPPPPFGLHSVNVSSSSIIGEASVGIGSRAGPYYTMQLPRGPPAPPLPPGYFHGPPLVHHIPTMGDIPAGRLSTSYPVQQGEEKSFEQQQVWQQMEQMQVHDHLHSYGYLRPVSMGNAAVSPLPQHLNSENPLVISSAPVIVTSGPFQLPAGPSAPRTQAPQSSQGNARISRNGIRIDVESPANALVAHQVLEEPLEEIGKSSLDEWEMGNSTTAGNVATKVGSEAGGRSNKNSKPSKEKRTSNKSKSAGSEDVVDVLKSEDGMSFSNSESFVHLPTQKVADDIFLIGQGYPHLLSMAGPTLGPSVYPTLGPSIYPHLGSSSLSPDGTGLMVSELSYPPASVPTPKISFGQTSLPSQTPLPVTISSSFNSSRPVTELVNGLSNQGTKQWPRPLENVPFPPSVYYPTGTPYPMVSFYNSANANQVFMMPPSPDYIAGLPLSKTLDSYSDLSAGQGEDLPWRFTQQSRPGVGERLKAAGVATSSTSSAQTSATHTRAASDAGDPNFFNGDLLGSDFSNHLRNLDYARSCQNPRVPVPMRAAQFLTHPPKYYPDYRPWEGPGRPLAPNMNMMPNVMSYGHGLVHGSPSMSTPTRMAGNFARPFVGSGSYSGDELPKSHVGTGTYLPNPRPPFIRERQSSGSGRNQYGGHSQERGDRVDRELNQVHGARFRGSGRGQSKYEPRSQNNVAVERNNVDLKGGERSRDRDVHRQQEGQRRNQSAQGNSLASPSTAVAPVTVMPQASAGLEMYSVPIMTGNGKSSTPVAVGGTMPAVVVYPPEKKMALVTDPLEFGSLGQVQVGTSLGGIEVDQGGGHVSALLTHEQVIAPPGLAGLSLASGDRSSQGASSPIQRVVQGTYQLKEEDFPPLSFRGQQGSSSPGLNSGSGATGSQSSYPGYVVTPPC